jgi:hypothetical protein
VLVTNDSGSTSREALLDWPGPPLGDAVKLWNGGSCLQLTGQTLIRVLPVVRSADPSARWRDRGTIHQLAFRISLPSEAGCSTILA